VNLLDFFIIFVALAAAARGVASGFLRQVGSLGGFVLGLLLGAWLTPIMTQALPASAARPVLALIFFFAVAFTLSGVGEIIGVHLAGLMKRVGLDAVDGVLGAVLGFGGALLALWLLASTFAGSVGPVLAADIGNSSILRLLDRHLPPAPEVTARLEHAIGASRFPRVFAGLEPTPAPPVTGPNAAVVNAAAAAAHAATVKIEGSGCGGVLEGSGFVAAPGLVATNAHVVAGIARPVVTDAAGPHVATVVLFDPDLDFAVLRTSGLVAAPLAIEPTSQPRGTVAAALGYPGGGGFTAGAAAILGQQPAVGRNIYDAGLIRRDIYTLQAIVRPGNSGGPLVAEDGTVIGVIFATSTTNSNVGYALTSPEILPDLARAAHSGAVSTGACVAD